MSAEDFRTQGRGFKNALSFRSSCISVTNKVMLSSDSVLYSSAEVGELIRERLGYFTPFYCGCIWHRLKYRLPSSVKPLTVSDDQLNEVLNNRSFDKDKTECQVLARGTTARVLNINDP